MTNIEVFRLEPEVGKSYEYAESTSTKGMWTNPQHFTTNVPLKVGRFISCVTGGYGDGGWRTDYFEDSNGQIRAVNYSYEGKTCFREVSCNIPSLQNLSRKVIKSEFTKE